MARYTVTNNGPGPRALLSPVGGNTIHPRESRVIEIPDKWAESVLKGASTYVEAGELVIEPIDDAPVVNETSDVITEATSDSEGAKTDENQDPGLSPDDPEALEPRPTRVRHLGFGRWYAVDDNGKRYTEAMTRNEGEAYAQEHGLEMGDDPNPSRTYDEPEGEAEEPVDPPDNIQYESDEEQN